MKIYCKVLSIRADRTSYKQYSPDLEPEDVWVEIDSDEIEGQEDAEKKILTLKGFTALLDVVATAVDDAHNAYKRRIQQGN